MSTTQTLTATPSDEDTTMKLGGKYPDGSGRMVPQTFSGSEDITIYNGTFIYELELEHPEAGHAYYYKISVTKTS